jgi:hypothetical protein
VCRFVSIEHAGTYSNTEWTLLTGFIRMLLLLTTTTTSP